MYQTGSILLMIAAMMVSLAWTKGRFRRQDYRKYVWFVFAVYALGNLYFTLLSRTPGSGRELTLLPFQSYARLSEGAQNEANEAAGLAAAFLQGTSPIVGIILNILLYYPFGYLLPILFPKLKPWQVILIGCLCSVATEATQYVFKMGWCETDDVIHNTLGTAIGVWVWHLQSKSLNKSTP